MPFPILIFFAIAGVIFSIVSAAKKREAQQRAQEAQRKQAERAFGGTPANQTGSYPRPKSPAQAAAGAARQEELKRRLEANAERRRLERESLQKQPIFRPSADNSSGRPMVSHSDEDCGGGSIHDGYHEGVTQFPNGKGPAVAGKLGHRLADEDDRLEQEKAAADNAKRVMARIAKLPPLAQGMVYSEILGKPKSEVC